MVDGNTLMDMGAFTSFRILMRRGGLGAEAGDRCTISYYLVYEVNDNLYPLISTGQLSPLLQNMFYGVVFDPMVPGATPTGTISGQVVNMIGNPLTQSRYVRLVLSDDTFAGVLDLSATVNFTAVGTGTLCWPVLPANQIIVQTNASGQFSVDFSGIALNSHWISAEPYAQDPNYFGMPVIYPGAVLIGSQHLLFTVP
jgi:hypothetical protein